MSGNLLIIFIKNSIKGKVKTRLAADLGEDVALKIYKKLMDRTLRSSAPVRTDIYLLFSDYVDLPASIPGRRVTSGLQSGQDLGERMLNAFIDGFKGGYRHICLLGTDCYEISSAIIGEAFEKLTGHDFVLGPSNDGGYYLIGMNSLLEQVFINKPWSTSTVLEKTLHDIIENSCSYELLPELVDVDTRADLELLNINLKTFLKDEK
ncbi:MAG: TIGR04282 family arsenosugar biosynthesis glycosyltransferase [Cyclobacteriaceae bacterium]|nr:TIGR04282 family arsenosugar biosynthesis glycosyltransferase [Cyclobacteriaceae bacterium]